MTKPEIGLLTLVAQNTWMFSLTSIFLVFIGWKVAYRNSAKLATRSESKSLIDALSKLINEISDASITYWLNTSKVETNQSTNFSERLTLARQSKSKKDAPHLFIMNVMARANQATRYVELLRVRGIELDYEELSLLLEKVTLDCETAFKMSDFQRAARVQEILDAAMNVIDRAHHHFQCAHPPSINKLKSHSLKSFYAKVEAWHKSLN